MASSDSTFNTRSLEPYPGLPALAVAPVRNGKGIVALRRFDRNALICEIKGRRVDAAQVWRYWETDPRLGANCFRFDDERYIDPEGQIGQYANHSCFPNAGLIKKGGRLYLKAIRRILPGDEVTHDYTTQLGADDVWTMRCNCGEDACRRVVRNISRLPALTLRRYRRLGIVPRFILETLN